MEIAELSLCENQLLPREVRYLFLVRDTSLCTSLHLTSPKEGGEKQFFRRSVGRAVTQLRFVRGGRDAHGAGDMQFFSLFSDFPDRDQAAQCGVQKI